MAEYVKEREVQRNAFWKVSEDAARIAKDAKMAALFTDAAKHLGEFMTVYTAFAEEYAEYINTKYENEYEDAKAKYDTKGEQKADKERDKTAEAVFNAIFGHLDDEEEDDDDEE